MLQTNTNITPKHRKNPLNLLLGKLVLRFCIITALTMQIPAETLSQTHRVCFTQRQAFPTSEHGIMIRI